MCRRRCLGGGRRKSRLKSDDSKFACRFGDVVKHLNGLKECFLSYWSGVHDLTGLAFWQTVAGEGVKKQIASD